MHSGLGLLRIKTTRSAQNRPVPAQPREGSWGLTPATHRRLASKPPQPRESGHAHHPHTAGRSPAELAVLPQGCTSAMVCKRCKRNSGSGPISCRLVLTSATTGPCPHVSNARPETPCSLALSLADKKKGFPVLPRTLAVTSRGDRIRTCDLVLPKQTKQ